MDMRRILRASLLTSAIAVGALACATIPVCAQMDQMGDAENLISFDSFHDQLASAGYWLYSDRWGIVWQPADVPYDFRPYYSGGHWVYTDDYGWYWLSDYSWGDIPFHYGRWVNDPDDGWLWIPGYIWSPGWVAWRTNGSVIGWMPLPPDDGFLEGRGDIGVAFRFGGFDVGALYARWYGPVFNERRFAQNWVFVPAGFIAVPNYQRFVIRDPVRIVTILHQTRNVTKYTVVNNIVVNKSVDVRVVERAAGHPVAVVHAAVVIRHPNLVARVDVGQRVQMRMREIVPHGRGMANSAPPPPARVVAKLSINVPPRNGRLPGHLFTKATVTAPEAQSRFHGAPVRGTAAGPGGEAGGAMNGPNAERMRNEQPNGPTGPTGERMRNEQPNGSAGATGERMRPEQSNGSAGPSGARMRGEQPNGPTGATGERMRPEQPNGSAGPSGERTRNEQPNGPAGPSGERTRNEQPNGPTGPGGERMRPEQPNGSAGPSGERMRNEQPNGPTGPGGERMPPEQPNGMTGPNAERMRPEQPNGMTGPNPERPRPQQPNGMNGPSNKANPQNNVPNREKQKKEQQNPPPNPPQ
jgi:hypothetical protein